MLQSALDLIADRGVDGVSIREIGRRAGVTLATVHHYFGTKAELHASVIAEMDRELEALVQDLFAGWLEQGPAEEKVATAVRKAFAFARGHTSVIRLLLRTVIESGDIGVDRLQRLQGPLLSAGGQLIAGDDAHARAMARTHVQNLIFLLARNAVATDRELMNVTGCEEPGEAREVAEAALIEVARAVVVPQSRG